MRPLLLLLTVLLAQDEAKPLLELRRAMREKKAAAAVARLAAHDALDAADYDKAVSERKRAGEIETQVAELKKREEKLAADAAASLIKGLMSDDIEVRERAATQLVIVGPVAMKLLEAVRKDADTEVRGRLDRVLKLLREIDVDEDGRFRQWAASAKASSQFSEEGCASRQATGKPDTLQGGDQRTAWAPAQQDTGVEWIELEYEIAVRPMRIRVHETCGPGTVTKVEARDAEGKWREVWKGADPTKECPGWFVVDVDEATFTTKTIRITLDTSLVAGWNEIDAVELIGDGVKK